MIIALLPLAICLASTEPGFFHQAVAQDNAFAIGHLYGSDGMCEETTVCNGEPAECAVYVTYVKQAEPLTCPIPTPERMLDIAVLEMRCSNVVNCGHSYGLDVDPWNCCEVEGDQ